MPGEVAEDEQLASADTDFKVRAQSVIVDTVTDSIHKRFSTNAKVCSDFACLNPRNVAHVKENGLPSSALEEISKCLLKFAIELQLAHFVVNSTALHVSGTD